jgi:tetratricopeptide (TPR) repeat protein
MKFRKITSLFNRGKTAEAATLQSTQFYLVEEIPSLKSKANELLRLGKLPEAIVRYQQIIALAPEDAGAYIALGYAQSEAGDLDVAKASFARALALETQSVDAHFLMGQLLLRQKQDKQAAQSFRAALALKPDFDHAWFELARVHDGLTELDAALTGYTRALAINPAFVGAAVGKVKVLLSLERWQEALEAVAIQSKSDEYHLMQVYKAVALQRLKRNSEALVAVDKVLLLHPTSVEALQVKGTILSALGRFEDALPVYSQAIGIDPKFAAAMSDAGAIYAKIGRFDEALAMYEQAINAQPDHADALYNRCTAFLHMGRCQDAIVMADKGLTYHPNHADMHWVKSAALLRSGEFEQGWVEYEWRWHAKLLGSNQAKPQYAQPTWTGQPIDGKTIWLYAEQGLGDTLQLLRYVPLLAARGAVVLLTVQDPINSLCSTLQRYCILMKPSQTVPAFDYHCPLFSLPLAFKTDLRTIPAQVPYLQCEHDLQTAWEEKLGAATAPRIGLAWSGNAAFQNDEKRSIPLAILLSALPNNFRYVSLQKEVRQSDQEVLARSSIFDASQDLRTFADTAALTACMDLVISVDTSVAHLAGALAKPLWVLLPYSPDWRWMMGRSDSVWYPTARLFRQQSDQSWPQVITQINKELGNMHW